MKFNNFVVREKAHQTFTVPSPVVTGNYAEERITFGPVKPGDAEQSFQGFTALCEGTFPTGATLELWLPRVPAGDKAASALTDSDYFFAGALLTASGAASVTPAGCWTGGQIRLKFGATTFAGTFAFSATAS